MLFDIWIARSYLDYWTALFIFGGFFALIFCCAVRITKLEKQMEGKKQVDSVCPIKDE